MDMTKGQHELDWQREYRCPGTKMPVPSHPMHLRISRSLTIICEANGVNRSRRSVVIPMRPVKPSWFLSAAQERFVARLEMERLLPDRSAEGSNRVSRAEVDIKPFRS